MSESSSPPEERLVKRVIARFRCAYCHRQHSPDNVSVMGTYDDHVWVIGVDCDGCQRPGMFIVTVRKDSSLEQVTDLTEDEQDRFLTAQLVDTDDVEGIRSFLKDFKGDFSGIFKRRGR
jgi:hypothetical protein